MNFAGSDHLRQVFGAQMGLSDKDIVALSGAHTLVSANLIYAFLVIDSCANFESSIHFNEEILLLGFASSGWTLTVI